MDKVKWKGVFNWQGEIFSLTTIAKSEEVAYAKFMAVLKKRLGFDLTLVLRDYFNGERNNYEITRCGKEDEE